MTGNARKLIRNFIGSAVAILLFCGASTFALQEKVSPLSDYIYKKDFPQYEAIKKEADPQKRAELLLGFLKERPISRLLLYAATDYIETVKPYIAKKDTAKVVSMIDTLMAALPTEKAIQEAPIPEGGADEFIKTQLLPARKLCLSTLVAVYYQAQNWPKAAESVEKLNEIAPDKATIPVLADIYLKMQNYDKYLEYGKKLLAEYPMDQPQGYTTAIQMAQVYIQKQDMAAATDLLSKVMDVYGDKVPPNMPEAQWNATRAFAYGIIAAGAYSKAAAEAKAGNDASQEYAKAQELYEKVIKFDPKRDDAYYSIGMCKWQNKDPEGAIDSFAKCVVLNKTTAKRAQQYLEELYKARHNDSLDGLDQVLEKAKSELGIS